MVAAFLVFYLVLVFGMAMIAPDRAMWLVVANAPSRPVFYVQILVRIMAGMALVGIAPRLFVPPLFTLLGWSYAIPAAILLLVPWKMHVQAADRATSRLRPLVRYIGVASLILGVTVAASFWRVGAP